MPILELRPREECAFDHVSLGEVMLRLDPGDMRVKTAREFRVWEGGGEYNVARGLRRCFGLRTAIVTALADNPVGRLVEDLMLTGGVDVSQVRWVPYDGLGRTVRNGLNFTERGFGIRGAQGVSDRGHTAASQLAPGDVDWEHIFGTLGARWFHTGGIYAGLSETTPEVIRAAMAAARAHGTIVSYDLNYRPSLWKSYGGQQGAQEVNRARASYVDVMIGNEEDFTACLGFEVPNTSGDLPGLQAANFKAMISQVTAEFGFSVVATTLRGVISASVNDWGAIAWSAPSGFAEATRRPALEIYDRVGGGDSFASGLIYGLLTSGDLQTAVEYGAAHGALAMTTPGDTSMASLAEVEALMAGASARVQRLCAAPGGRHDSEDHVLIDHLVYAVPDLPAAVTEIAERFGVQAQAGGRHTGRGTHNALLALGPQTYLEIIAPDPEQPDPAVPRPFGLDGVRHSSLVRWALACNDIDAAVAGARSSGYDPGDVIDGLRADPAGTLLRWRMTAGELAGGLAPFLISWGDTEHPARSAPPGLTLEAFHIEHPDPPSLAPLLTALGADAEIKPAAAAALVARLSGPNGRAVLR